MTRLAVVAEFGLLKVMEGGATAKVSSPSGMPLQDAILALNTKLDPDGVSKWFKQDAIHEHPSLKERIR